MAGDSLVEVVDLSSVWVWVDFYQDDLPLLTNGLPITLTSETDPAWRPETTIAQIDPFLDEAKRTCRARVDLSESRLQTPPANVSSTPSCAWISARAWRCPSAPFCPRATAI